MSLPNTKKKKNIETECSVEFIVLAPKFKIALLCLILCLMAEASIAQNLIRKIKLCFPCGNSSKQYFKYTFKKNIWTCNIFWLVWIDEKALFFIWKIYDHEVSINQSVWPRHTNKAFTYWVMLKRGKIKVKLVHFFPSQQKKVDKEHTWYQTELPAGFSYLGVGSLWFE